MSNQFIGKPAEYLRLGGGLKIDFILISKKQYHYGLNMGFYGNKLKKDYPLDTDRDQYAAPPSLIIGGILGKGFEKFSIQAELNITVQNITDKLGADDPDWIQLKGWSPGLVMNYPIQFGKTKTTYSYGSPYLSSNLINFHFGLRNMKYDLKEASGLMTEIGIGYKLRLNGIKEFKLKDEFLQK